MKRRPSLLAVPVAALALTAAGCGGHGAARPEAATVTRTKMSPPMTTAAPASPRSTASAQPPSAQDRTWLAAAHRTNLTEVAAGELARSKGATSAVRSAGALLVTDHTSMDRALQRVAAKLGVTLPGRMSSSQKALIDRLAGQSGRQFDQAFLKAMIPGHQRAIAKTEGEIQHGNSPLVVLLARRALPMLQKHLAVLRQAQGSG